MKKLFLGMAALVAMVATSCVQTEELGVANNKEAIAFDGAFVDNGTRAADNFTIKTDKKHLGDALTEHGLIEGEESTYGLYIKKVNGMRADYELDGYYWAFYENGEYATSGVDTTNIVAGASYAFKVSK